MTVRTTSPLFAAALRSDPTSPLGVRSGLTYRGQAPAYEEDPAVDPGINSYTTPSAPAQTYVSPYGDPNAATSGGMFAEGYGQPVPYGADPFLAQPGGPGGPCDSCGQNFSYGLYGPQPYRLGWSSRYDVGYIFAEDTDGVAGEFEQTEFNMGLRHTKALANGMIFSTTPEFNMRWWSGPSGVALPGEVYRFASDFELAWQSPVSPWSYQLGFTPQVVSDLESSLNSDGYSFDGRGVIFYRSSPQWMFAFGAAYWDRVIDRVIPYAGVVWTPGDRWEFRLMFPKSRISYFLGNWGDAGVWLYGSGEYNVEAYQVQIQDTGVKDRVEFSDYRLMIGLRSEYGGVSSFIEGGWVLDRQVEFKGPTTDFDIDDGILIRAGLRF